MTLQLRDLRQPGPCLGKTLAAFAGVIVENIDRLPDRTSVRIHDIRVSTKKIRSLLRLARHAVPAAQCKALVALLREIKNTFSGSRDEEVMRLRLRQIFPKEMAAGARMELGLRLAKNPQLPETAPAAEKAAELRRRLEALDLSALTRRLLAKNAADCYRRTRKVMRQCEDSPTDEKMHEWRKRVKDVCYHAMALSGLAPMKELCRPLDALAEDLGEYHDLALLEARARGHKKISASVSAGKRRAGRRCFKAAAPLFEPPPGRFARRIVRALKETEA